MGSTAVSTKGSRPDERHTEGLTVSFRTNMQLRIIMLGLSAQLSHQEVSRGHSAPAKEILSGIPQPVACSTYFVSHTVTAIVSRQCGITADYSLRLP